jgi:hypothetical protein
VLSDQKQLPVRTPSPLPSAFLRDRLTMKFRISFGFVTRLTATLATFFISKEEKCWLPRQQD